MALWNSKCCVVNHPSFSVLTMMYFDFAIVVLLLLSAELLLQWLVLLQ